MLLLQPVCTREILKLVSLAVCLFAVLQAQVDTCWPLPEVNFFEFRAFPYQFLSDDV